MSVPETALTESPVGILTAIREELHAIRQRLSRVRVVSHQGFSFHQGVLAGRPVVVVASGMGPERARHAAAALIEKFGPCCLLIAGFAAGLREEIQPGNIVVASALLDRTMPCCRPGRLLPHPILIVATEAILLPGICLHRGEILTLNAIATDSVIKRELAAGNARVIAADMESAGAAVAAEERGAPWLAVRVVTDTLNDDFPINFQQYLSPDGEIRRERVMRAMIARPWKIPALVRLGCRAWQAARNLAMFVESFVVALQKDRPFG